MSVEKLNVVLEWGKNETKCGIENKKNETKCGTTYNNNI